MTHADTAALRRQAMRMLADAGALFLGQGVVADGVATFADFEDVPASQKIEFPVAEELNVGAAMGLSLTGVLAVVSLPRIDFLLRAADQLVNHLDKLEIMSVGQFKPKVIVRTRIGSRTPLDAGPQHTGDHVEAFRLLLPNTHVWRIETASAIMPTYRAALEASRSVVVVEAL